MRDALPYPNWPVKPQYCNPDSYMFSFSKVPDQGDSRACHSIDPTPTGGSKQLNQNHTRPQRLAPDVSQAEAAYPYHCYQPRTTKSHSGAREGVSIVLSCLCQIVERNLPSGMTTHQEPLMEAKVVLEGCRVQQEPRW